MGTGPTWLPFGVVNRREVALLTLVIAAALAIGGWLIQSTHDDTACRINNGLVDGTGLGIREDCGAGPWPVVLYVTGGVGAVAGLVLLAGGGDRVGGDE